MTLLNNPTPMAGMTPSVSGQAGQQDTLQARIENILNVVDQCHGLLASMEDRITGPRPGGEGKEAIRKQGLAALTMELSARCINLRARLEEVLNAL